MAQGRTAEFEYLEKLIRAEYDKRLYKLLLVKGIWVATKCQHRTEPSFSTSSGQVLDGQMLPLMIWHGLVIHFLAFPCFHPMHWPTTTWPFIRTTVEELCRTWRQESSVQKRVAIHHPNGSRRTSQDLEAR